jgi:hypothetical protein
MFTAMTMLSAPRRSPVVFDGAVYFGLRLDVAA